MMESFQTPFIVCLRTGALQEQDEPAPLELLGALEQNPDTETEQNPITTPPTICSRLQHQPPIFINISPAFAHRHITVAAISASLGGSNYVGLGPLIIYTLNVTLNSNIRSLSQGQSPQLVPVILQHLEEEIKQILLFLYNMNTIKQYSK